MNSPLLELFSYYGIDPAYIMIGLFVFCMILLIMNMSLSSNYKRLARKYDRFMRGKNGESLEAAMIKKFDRLDKLEEDVKANREQIRDLNKDMMISYQKKGLVKYDAFREMSGQLSYALVLLDKSDNGIVINSMYSREGCYTYAKNIKGGKCEMNLSNEEEEALKIALNGEKND